MAYLVGTTQTAKQPTGTSYAVTFPSGVAAGDLLLVLLSQDGSTESLGVSASGFTALGGTQTESGACSSLWFYKIAAGGETTATFACANDDIIGTAMLWRDAHATAPFGATPTSGTNFVRTDWTGVASAASGSLTPPEDDCTLVYAWCADGNTTYMRTQLSECVNIDAFASDAIGHIIGYRQQGTAAAAPTVTMYANIATEGGNGWVLAIRNKSGGALSPTVLGGTNEIQWYGSWSSVGGVTGATLVPANWTALSGFAASINGISTATTIGDGTSTNAVGSTNTPLNVTLWGLVSRVTMTDFTAGNWSGGRHPINSIDLTGKIVSVQASMDIVTPTRFGPNGLAIVFGDAGGNWVAYKLAERTGLVGGLSYTFHVAPGQGTALDSSGDIATTLSAVTQVGYMVHRIGSSASANVLTVFNLTVSDTATITGGGNSDAASAKFSSMYAPMRRFSFGDMNQLQASAQTMAKTIVQIGDGDTPTYFDATASSFEFPPTYSATYGVANTQNTWNVTANDVGLTIKAAAGDTINMTAAVIATVTEQPLTIHADCDVSAVSFAGSSIVGYTVTDNAGLSWSSATFKSAGTVTIAGGGDMTNCSISKTTSANAALAITASGSTLDGCTIDGTGAAYALELGTGVKEITIANSAITAGSTDKAHTLKTAATVTAGSLVTGDHYEIKTVGTTDFTLIGAIANTIGVRFTATGAGSGTGDAYVAVKITISGTTSLAESDVTSAGAVVWVAAPTPTLDATVLSGSRVVLYNDTTAAELDNTAPAGTSWSKVITSGASSGDALTLHVFKEGYEEFSTSFIYAGINNTLLVSQSVHAAIASLRTELSITDYTTITEFALDITGTVEIDANDADGSTTKARLAIWYNGVLTTENGARYLRGAITILSTAAFRINTSILDLKIENVSVTYGLNFTDIERRLYRDDGAAIYAPASAPGSIQNDYSGVPDTVTTSDQSLNLATAEQAIDNKLSSISSGVWAYVVTGSTTAVQMMRGFAAMLLGKVSGAGTGAETFRDIADTKDVATFTVDSSGNRTAVTRDLT